jgi:hypothetical protein
VPHSGAYERRIQASPDPEEFMTRMKMALCAAVAACVAGAAAPAMAEEEPPPSTTAFVTQVRPVIQASATMARAQFHYRCIGTAETDHLYVAVKQGPSISPANTSSAGATSYFSTNWNSDKGSNALKCDGKKHVMHVALRADGIPTGPPPNEQSPPPTRPSPPLARGTALLQICVFDNTGLTMNYSMRKVVRI